MNAPLAEMFRYNRWANDTLLGACQKLSDEQLDSRLQPGVRSVRENLLHLVGGQQTFVLRTKGRQHEGELTDHSEWPGWDALLSIATQTSDELIAIAEALDADREVALPWQGKRYRFPASFFLAHAIEHGVEHRTEIKLTLRAIGVDTPDLDAWNYSEAEGYGQPA